MRARFLRRAAFPILAALYFGSGAIALIDEVVFFKYLSLAFGATAHASSAVLVAFMGGLAAGAALAARLDGRIRAPLRVYGALEVAVGIACALSPWLFGAVTRAYVAVAEHASSLATLEAARAVLACAVVLLPTIAMGATLPLLARVGGKRVALLYGLNTAGGATGSLLGTYAVIPALGLAATVRAGALISVAIGLTAIAMSWLVHGKTEDVVSNPRPSSCRLAAQTNTTIAAAASGLLVFASEVVFVHLLALVDGTSVYVFGLVVAVFLIALAGGASASRALHERAGDNALSASLAISGLALAATIPAWDMLPGVFVALGPYVSSWQGREAVRALVAALAIGAPATAMGLTFPIVLAESRAPHDARGRLVGRATAVNTVASIGGSLLGAFVLLPAFGSQRALCAIAMGYALAALAVRAPRKRPILALSAATAITVALAPRWDLARLASGTNIYFERQPEQGKVSWITEDVHSGVVTVTRRDGISTLWTNGKYQGDDSYQMAAQRGFADIPAMFVPRFGRALAVGVGTGTTIGALAEWPFERIEVAELSPGIVEAARSLFGRVNGGVLDSPRVAVRLEDGRNLLLVGAQRYDLITIELTSIWFAGAGNLYNRELYEIAARRLTEGGILSQWIQIHHTTTREIASQMATAREVFAHAALFVRGYQGVLVLGREPLRARGSRSPGDLDDLVLADESLDAFIDEACKQWGTTRAALVSTDDNLRLEYATPRNNVPGLATIADNTAMLRRWRRAELAERLAR